MGERLLEVVKQVGIFMICAQMILHFKPAERYGKYIRLLMSTMVLVQLIVPVFEIFQGKEKENFPDRIVFYDKVLEESMTEISLTNTTAETILEEMTLEEVKTRINNLKQNTDSEPGEVQDDTIQIERIEVNEDD